MTKRGGHNIPHYANVARVKEAGYESQPFAEKQTLFNMPPEQTQERRLDEFRSQGVSQPEKPYSAQAPIFDGEARQQTLARNYSSEVGNKEGTWLSTGGNKSKEGLAIPGHPDAVASAAVPNGEPLRLSRAGDNKFGKGGEEQVELRGPDWKENVKFSG